MPDFGRYRLLRKVGTGGMAEIWKATVRGPAGFEKEVAIKKVLPDLLDNTQFIDMFIAEAKLVASLNHPNIVQVFDFGQVGPDYYIAMEYVAGTNLASALNRFAKRKARIPMEVALYVTSEACRGLGYAHARTDPSGRSMGIIHRDVSPQNILVSYTGEVKVTDFGIAKMSSAISRTTEGQVRGKLAYMSPEQATAGPLDHHTDLFSMGLLLWEMLTGAKYFTGTDPEVYSKIVGHKPLEKARLDAVPAFLRPLLFKALHPSPMERHADAREFETELNVALTSDGHFLARDGLATLLREAFKSEHEIENTPLPPEDSVKTGIAPSGSLPLQMGSLASLEVSDGTVVSQTPAKSGLTLVPQSRVIDRPLARMEGRGASRDRTEPRKKSFGVLILAISAATVMAAFLGGWLIPKLGVQAISTPAPTPVAVASLTPLALPSATPAVVAVAATPTLAPRTTPRQIATPRPTPVVLAKGALTVIAVPWVEVWVDGKKVARETPLRKFELPSGRHTLKFANPAMRYSDEKVVSVPADGVLSLFVDVRKGTIEIE